MPIFVVGARNERVAIPHRALSVSITGAVSAAELEIRCSAGQPVVRSSAHYVVLPRLADPVMIAVRPVGAPRFASSTVIHLAIGDDDPGILDPVQVLFDPVDVSGDGGVVLAALTPRGQQIEVAVSAVADVPLSPLAAAARTSARNAVGRGSLGGDAPVVLAVDSSASMRPWFTDGSVAAVAEVVVGVADAAGLRDVSAVLVGSDVTGVAPSQTGTMADAVRAIRPRWSAGARWARLPAGPAFTVVCTDFVTAQVRQHFLVIGLSDESRQDWDGARLPPPPPGRDAIAEMLAQPLLLDSVTAPLAHALAGRRT